MASRLWFLAQATSRFAVDSLSRHTAKPSLRHSYSVRRFLCADRKSDTFKLSSHVGADVMDEPSEEAKDSSELPKSPKSDGKVIKQY